MVPTEATVPGLFAQLEPLLDHRAVLITVSKLEGDQLQVNICPRQLKEDENSALTVPLCVTGTAAERLDSFRRVRDDLRAYLRSEVTEPLLAAHRRDPPP